MHRFNSWDLVQEPVGVLTHALAGLTRPLALAGIVAVFTCLTVGQAFTRTLLVGRLRGATG
ncbi:MAG: hypothetical protein ACRDYF_02480 [Acidimicrobiia bacterium]